MVRLPSPAMNSLPHPDHLHFDAAQGWFMLGDFSSAADELAQLSPAAQAEPEVMEFAWSVQAQAQNWSEAFRLADLLVQSAPHRAFGWIHRAYALRRLPDGSLERAWDALRPAFEKFPKQFLIPYNLACYAAQLGHLDDAWDWLQRAIAAAGTEAAVRKMALADTDLAALWPKLKPSP